MNLIQKMLSKCGRDYVLLEDHDGELNVRPVKWICGYPVAYRRAHYKDSQIRLLPNGECRGGMCNYVYRWEPLTDKINKVFFTEAK